MEYAFAPMEGLTDRIFRRLHHRYFPGVDRYYMPFYSPTIHRSLTPKEHRELPPAAEEDAPAVPQILTKHPEDFLWAAGVCRDLGYSEVNLNLGCPSGTVVAKGKGSGMLRDPEALDRFLEVVFQSTPLPVSVKTRIGLERPEEFPAILAVFNRYPLARVIVHPRLRSQYYKGEVHLDVFACALEHSRNPLYYNGDIDSLSQAEALALRFPGIPGVMIGRGLLADPGMLCGCRDAAVVQAFMDELLTEYTREFGSSRNAMFRLKEHWSYLRRSFPEDSRLWKQLRKTTDVSQYRDITREIFQTLPYAPGENTHHCGITPQW